MARIDDFGAAIAKHVSRYPVYPNVNAELSAIADALNADTTLHDATIVTPPQELTIGGDKTPFTNNILHVINKGRGANLRSSQMGSAINSLLGMSVSTPAISTPPTATPYSAAVGDTLTASTGVWDGAPSSYEYQWGRTTIGIWAPEDIQDATSSTHVLRQRMAAWMFIAG